MKPKYHVIKIEDWEETVAPQLDEADAVLVENGFISGEFFVVRDQDVFAPAGLYAYAANIHSAIEFQDTLGPSVMEEDVRERLLVLADELTTLAEKWKANRTSKKVPD